MGFEGKPRLGVEEKGLLWLRDRLREVNLGNSVPIDNRGFIYLTTLRQCGIYAPDQDQTCCPLHWKQNEPLDH